MNKELAKTIGAAARQARKALQLTQLDASDRVGVSVEFYARIERGSSLPSILTFARIVSGLGVSADVLLGVTTNGTLKNWAPALVDDPANRRLLRRIRKARPSALRLIELLLKELEPRGEDT